MPQSVNQNSDPPWNIEDAQDSSHLRSESTIA